MYLPLIHGISSRGLIVLVAKNVILINKAYLLILCVIDNYVMALLYLAFHLISVLPLILFFLEEFQKMI